ncbi:MAG: TonB-dependent receptor [Candidatus Nitricoxidivorans perseverans]|uniref:TonB-dependent receptor n=1 Tax=Candidatus Nitricoxidivorans perseverans TaxID=2975601 RepID=A0AA49IUU0_9PROT|nr:MAG: TonB-dependent receptor [Candidatus Nitricoxidivorans perseverans]
MRTTLLRKTLRLLPRAMLAALACPAASDAQVPLALADHSLEQLMDMRVEVTSAARKPQKLEDSATAIHVITREDIRRSGMTSLPEVLRLAPGLQVARLDGGTWAISSRGFNAKNSDNLLVMQDGRVLHTPTFTGVYWNAQDIVLEDVDRIEVIRGPGGALWGANAVTGVINIVTRPAQATQGGVASGGIGSHERQGMVRHGGKLGETGYYRIYAKRADQDDFEAYADIGAHDRRDMSSAGFRTDWELLGGDSLTVQGDVHAGRSNHTGTALTISPPTSALLGYPIDLRGGNLLARWKRALSATEEWSLQLYYDHYDRRYFNLGERRDTVDLDFQHRFLWGGRHDIVWGFGYRRTSDDMRNTDIVSYMPARRTDSVASAFVQDEVALDGDKLHLILGSKFEHNDYTGTEVQPNLRLRWKPDKRSMAWTAVSRAVHTPSRTDTDGRVVSTVVPAGPSVYRLQGGQSAQSEHVDSLEAGWRAWPTERLQMDVAAFYSRHRNLTTIEREASFPEAGYTVYPLVFHNKAKATTRGLELSGSWRPADRWQFKASHTWLSMNIRRDVDSTDTSIEGEEGRSPRSQFQFHAFHSLSARVDVGASLYYTDELPSLEIPAHARLDARIAWRAQRDLELVLIARNLLDPVHPEFTNTAGPRTTEVPRSLIATATWRF